MAPKGPYRLCTVNKVPARAKILIGRVVEDVKEEYTIDYVANAESESFLVVRVGSFWITLPSNVGRVWKLRLRESRKIEKDWADLRLGIEEVKGMCEREKPDVLVSYFLRLRFLLLA